MYTYLFSYLLENSVVIDYTDIFKKWVCTIFTILQNVLTAQILLTLLPSISIGVLKMDLVANV